VEDEEGEGVWGYLVPLDHKSGDVLVLKRRSSCPVPESRVGNSNGRERVPRNTFKQQEENYESEKQRHGTVAGGYLIGRHPECGECCEQLRPLLSYI
jgi:serine/threonine-protein kinase Chk2